MVVDYSYPFDSSSIFICTAGGSTTPYLVRQLKGVQIEEERIYTIDSYDNNLMYILNSDQKNLAKERKKIQELKDLHKGKRCFVVGNGPSLTIDDLESINKEVSFGCNSIYALFPYTKWRPTYYIATDTMMTEVLKKEKKDQEILSQVEGLFTGLTEADSMLIESLERNKVYFLNCVWGIRNKENVINALLSHEVDEKIYTIGSVLYTALQVALYMGFQEIYLLGVDMSFSVEEKRNGEIQFNDVTNHQEIIEKEDRQYQFMQEERFGNSYVGRVDNQVAGYISVKRYSDEKGIKVYNATRGGKLEVFERVALESLF